MNSTLIDLRELSQSSDISISGGINTRQWLVIIGIVTIILLLLSICIRCIFHLRHIYQHIEIDDHKSKCEYSNYQPISLNDFSARSIYTV
ncbi:hypothetical protein I4U23_013368 [Adineta vaga]|nr:hypothetical protein I4U23_013368 [Adineta vaga]